MAAESDLAAAHERMQKAQSVNADGVGVQRRSASDEIAWLRFHGASAAAASPAAFLHGITVKLVPPGAS